MKLILETSKSKKIVVENSNVHDVEFALDNLSIEYMFEQMRAKLEEQRDGQE